MLEATAIFSVVIPLYNTERYIAATLDSVIAQTFGDFEIIVVNDASTDAGPEIVRRYMQHDRRIRMLTQENRGLAGARNTGIRHARGRYIALLDADDLWAARKLELHKAHLDTSPETGVSFAPSIIIDEDGRDLGLAQTPKLDRVSAEDILCRNPVGNGSAAVIRREALDDIEFEITIRGEARTCWFDESFRQSEDIELWTRMAATTRWRFSGVAEPLTCYRVGSGGLSANVVKQFESWQRMRAKLAGLAPDLVARVGRRAEAYQLRYIARRAGTSGDGAVAMRSMAGALRSHPRILTEEPARTLATLALCGIARLLPGSAQSAVKSLAFDIARRMRGSPSTSRLTEARAPAGMS
ncbi:MAG: glycosyltransferase family 2 protein [Hyphomicrobiaceae bacterium]